LNPEFLLHLAELNIAPSLEGVSEERLVLVVSFYGALMSLGLVVDFVYLRRWRDEQAAWAPAVQRLLRRPWPLAQALTVAAVTLAAFAGATACLAGLNALLAGRLADRPTLAVCLQSLFMHVPVLVFLFVYVAHRGVGWREAFGVGERTWGADLRSGLYFYVGALPLIGFFSWLYQLGLEGLGYDTDLQDVALLITDEASLIVRIQLLVMSVFLAPVFEELLFRGIALPVLARRYGTVTAVVVVSACFAVIHQHLPSMVALFLLAVSFSWAYIRTGSIRVPIVMHACFNIVNLGLLLYLRVDAQ
jgi:membrane protease YdiL (CAAX protease family)